MAMLPITSNSTLSSPHFNAELEINKLEERITETVINTFKKMIYDQTYRISNCKDNPSLLNKGIFSPLTYLNLLKLTQNYQAIEQLKNGNCFIDNYVRFVGFKKIINNFYKDDNSLVADQTSVSLVLEKGYCPSDAIISLMNDLTLCDSVYCNHIIQYWIIYQVLGKEKFDAMFDAQSSSPLIIGIHEKNPIQGFKRYFENPSMLDREYTDAFIQSIQPGDFIFIENIDRYKQKHLFDVLTGINLICTRVINHIPKFMGLGFSNIEFTLDELHSLLIDIYNKDPLPLDDFLTETEKKSYEETSLEQIQRAASLKYDQLELENTKHLFKTVKYFWRLDAKVLYLFSKNTITILRQSLDSFLSQEIRIEK